MKDGVLKWAGMSLLSASLLALLVLELLLWPFSLLLVVLAWVLVLRGAESETRGSSPGKWWCIDVQGR